MMYNDMNSEVVSSPSIQNGNNRFNIQYDGSSSPQQSYADPGTAVAENRKYGLSM